MDAATDKKDDAEDDGGGERSSVVRVGIPVGDQTFLLFLRNESVLPPNEARELTIRVLARSIELRDKAGTVVGSWKGNLAHLGESKAAAWYPGVMFLQVEGGPFRLHKLELIPINGEPSRFELSGPDASPDRLLAERTLWKGGKVRLSIGGHPSNEVDTLDELPESMKLYGVYARSSSRGLPFADEDLALAARAPHLHSLDLRYALITDAGLAHLAKSENLHYLVLMHTGITDAGLAHVGRLPRLEALYLQSTSVGNAGMMHLRGLKSLDRLGISNTQVGDDGIAALAPALQKAKYLCVCYTKATEKSAAVLGQLTNLETLHLGGVPLDDEHAKMLYGLENLRQLRLVGSKVTDEGKQALRRHLLQVKLLK